MPEVDDKIPVVRGSRLFKPQGADFLPVANMDLLKPGAFAFVGDFNGESEGALWRGVARVVDGGEDFVPEIRPAHFTGAAGAIDEQAHEPRAFGVDAFRLFKFGHL